MELEQAQELLESISFGSVAAEIDPNLADWFVSTLAFRRVTGGDISLVLGTKGTGKTAIYRVLVENYGFIEGLEQDIIIPTTDIQGISDFSQLLRVAQGQAEDYRQLWKLYFALLLGRSLFAGAQIFDINVSRLRSLFQNTGLIPDSAISRLGQWLAETVSKVKVGIVYQGLPVSLGIDLQSNAVLTEKPLDVWEVLSEAQAVLSSADRRVWILIDRLDELFSGMSNGIERRQRALQGLMASLLDFEEFSKTKVVVFLRSDLYEKLSFVNKDHLTDRKIEIKWGADDLKLLIARRVASSEKMQEWSQIEKEPAGVGVSEAGALMKFVLEGSSEDIPSVKIEGILNMLRNGHEEVTPRDVIHLFSEAQRLQLEDIERGIFDQNNPLIPKDTIVEAFKIVSRDKVNDFVLGEFPEVQGAIRQLEGQRRARFSKNALEDIFGSSVDKSVDELLFVLHEIGILRPLGSYFIQRARRFEIPVLYRPALGIPYPEIEHLLS